MHKAYCQFHTERIALVSSSKELHQIVNKLLNRYLLKIFSTIYPSADLPSLFIVHFNDEVENPRANIVSEPVTSNSTLVTGKITAAFYSLEKVPQSKVKECILNSSSKSYDLDPILPDS